MSTIRVASTGTVEERLKRLEQALNFEEEVLCASITEEPGPIDGSLIVPGTVPGSALAPASVRGAAFGNPVHIVAGSVWGNTDIAAKSITSAPLYPGATVRNFVGVPIPAGWTLGATNQWVTFVSTTFATAGGFILVFYYPSIFAVPSPAQVVYAQCLFGATNVGGQRYDLGFASGINKVPLHGFSTFAALAAGSYSVLFQYYATALGLQVPTDTLGVIWIVELS